MYCQENEVQFALVGPNKFQTYYIGGLQQVKFAKAYSFRSVLYYSNQTPAQDVIEIIANDIRPDFWLVTFSMLYSLFTYSAVVDSKHVEDGKSLSTLPSQTRQKYGFLFQSLSPKLLLKNGT